MGVHQHTMTIPIERVGRVRGANPNQAVIVFGKKIIDDLQENSRLE